MLRCPKCNRSYQDDMQKFCTHDGGRLVPDIDKPQSFDPNATVHADLSNLDIPVTPTTPPVVAPPQPTPPPARQPDLNATIAGPPPAPATGTFRPPAENPTSNFPPQQTTRLSQPLPEQDVQVPSAPAPPPPPQQRPEQPAPVQPPRREPTPAPFPTMMMAPPGPPPLPPTTGAPVQPEPPRTSNIASPSSALPQSHVTAQVQAPSQPLPAAPAPSQPLAAPPKKSKLGLVLALVGVLVLLVLVGGGVGAYFYLNRQKTTEANNTNTGGGVTVPTVVNNNANSNASSGPTLNTKPAEAPPNSVKFQNSDAMLDGKLKEHYVDFYFYYPQGWLKSDKAGVPGANNFVEVERRLPPDFTQEDLVVSWYESKGTVEADLAGKLPTLVKDRDASLAKIYPEYQKISEGKTTINGIEGYEFRFKAVSRATAKGDINIWGRMVFLPPGDEESTKGVTLYMLTTSLAPELQGVEDVGVKGELPMILNSFTLGKS